MPATAPPSRWLLILAGLLTQLVGLLCLVLGLASLPILHDLHAGTGALIASIIAAFATVICGTLVWRGRLIPLALAAGLDVGFGIGLPRGSSAISALLRMLPKDEVATAEALVTGGAIAMFVAAILCVLAIPSALKLRNWARGEIEREARAAIGADGERVKRAASNPYPTGQNPAASTLRGVGAAKLMPTQVLRVAPRSKPAIIIGVAVSLIAIGIVVISAATGASKAETIKLATADSGSAATGSGSASGSGSPVAIVTHAGSGSAAPVVGDAGVADAAGPEQPAVEDLVTRFHAALAHAKAGELALVFDAKAFAFGVEAHEIAEGRDAVVATVLHDLGSPGKGFDVASRFAQVAHDGDVAWVAEELKIGTKTFVTTYAAGLRDGAWTISALHFAQTVPNDTAYKLAREGELPMPDAIPDAHDDSPLAQAMRTGFASKPSFVAARSARPEGFNFGSGPGERVSGGENIKKLFARIKATVRLPGAVKVGLVGERGGWGAANVEFTDADRDGTDVTQTFRVLAVWLKEDAGWRIVLTQWSNPK